MCRRFLESFEECIKCPCREHMYLIDDIDFVFSLIGRKTGFFYEVADVLYTVVRCTIDLDRVEHRPIIKCLAILTCMTGIAILEVETIDSLREDTSTRRLASSARSCEYIRMSDSIMDEGGSEYPRDSILSDNRVPISGAIGGVEAQCLAN
jgi:hypothetical protein